MKRLFLPILIIFMSLTCTNTADNSSASGKNFPDWTALATELENRMALEPGEKVLLVASPGEFDPLIELIRNSIMTADAQDLGVFSVTNEQPVEWSTDFTEGAGGLSGVDLESYFTDIDLGIMMPGAGPNDIPYAAMQNVLRTGKGRTIHFHWSGAYDLAGQPLQIGERENQLYQKVILETDYQALSDIQGRFENAMRQELIHVSTKLGTNISFRIGDRPVTRQDGNASRIRMLSARNLIDREIEIPAGAIRVAPIEESVHGTIAFPDSRWNGEAVSALLVSIERGKITEIRADSGQSSVRAELDAAGETGYSFREFAIGFNPLLAIPEEDPWIPYYGYGSGVVRLSLGDNTELGGNVTGGYVRWNFFTDATVTVGDRVWVEDGKLILPTY